jgi:hypothetical protein
MMSIALAFTLPQTQYGTAMVIEQFQHISGKRVSQELRYIRLRRRRGPGSREGIGRCSERSFPSCGISGDKYGTAFGCPAMEC